MMTTTTEPLRIGILGAAAIAQKNCIAIGLADGCVVTAIASRTREKAEVGCATTDQCDLSTEKVRLT
jgi:predicted dehydrogenase